MRFPPQEEIPDGHAFAETRQLCVRDQRLRAHGFRIRQRPRGQQAVWSLGERSYTQEEAEQYVRRLLCGQPAGAEDTDDKDRVR